jgi:hypothetical protein
MYRLYTTARRTSLLNWNLVSLVPVLESPKRKTCAPKSSPTWDRCLDRHHGNALALSVSGLKHMRRDMPKFLASVRLV